MRQMPRATAQWRDVVVSIRKACCWRGANISTSCLRQINGFFLSFCSAQLLFAPLLKTYAHDAPVDKEQSYRRDVDELLNGLIALRDTRWSAERLLQHIADMQRRYEAETVYSLRASSEKRQLQAIGEQFWSSAEQRCQSRYC